MRLSGIGRDAGGRADVRRLRLGRHFGFDTARNVRTGVLAEVILAIESCGKHAAHGESGRIERH